MTGNDDDIRILSRQTVYRGFARIDRIHLRHRLHAGGWSKPLDRELYDRGHVVGVLPYDPVRDRVVLVRQFRIGAHEAGFPPWQTEAIAGMIDPGETPEQVAIREAHEEAGLEITALEPIAHYLSSPGASSESVRLFCGCVDSTDAGGVHGLDAEHEDIAVTVRDAAAIPELLADPVTANGLTLIALQWLQGHRERLRRLWSETGDR